MTDCLPAESRRWLSAEESLRRILRTFAYEEIRTPILEETELFARSIGATTDVVEKEMFSFTDKGGDALTLRPENTASVIRSYLENNLAHGESLSRLYYIGPMFRHERPQKGRLRQFHQAGVEAIGSASPLVDAEVITLLMTILERMEVPSIDLQLNSVGDAACRPAYREKLQGFLRSIAEALCANCQRRTETNPMRVFDCKSQNCQAAIASAPLISDHLCADCKTHLSSVQGALEAAGIRAELNPRIVRGLDYYERTAFEVTAGGLGSQNAVGAGGRYDGLAEALGGPRTPAIGWALGIERLLLSTQKFQNETAHPHVVIIPLEAAAAPTALKLSQALRTQALDANKALTVELLSGEQSLKSGLRLADKKGARWAILLGSGELAEGAATLKDLPAHTQEKIPFLDLPSKLIGQIL